eukprot:TRINITY_DN12833_c0_g1_i2.p1 TRINITY_DN12833_c0_g1~~TRINITY_DN12833_c0_g1_i2.p1  ORF type:complete len:116 (+),score=24.58 TRINITY_DN12833_c0_g1_i2:285-632(+)
MTAGCMSDDLTRKLEYQLLPFTDEISLYTVLRRDFGWDAFSEQRGIVALGPDVTRGTSMLVDDSIGGMWGTADDGAVSYTHLRAHETPEHLVCRLLLEKKKQTNNRHNIRLDAQQ